MLEDTGSIGDEEDSIMLEDTGSIGDGEDNIMLVDIGGIGDGYFSLRMYFLSLEKIMLTFKQLGRD